MAREKSLARPERGEIQQFEPWNTFREMERMFQNFFTSAWPMTRPPGWLAQRLTREYLPDVDLRESDREYVVSLAAPGMTKDDFEISCTRNRVTISGERKTEEEKPDERYHFRQQSYGSFSVSYELPADVKPDEVKATYKNGILEVSIPKAETTEAHKVPVEVQD